MTERVDSLLIETDNGKSLKADYYLISEYSEEYKTTLYTVGIFMPETGEDERLSNLTSRKNTAMAIYESLIKNRVTAMTLKETAENIIG